MMAEPWYDYPDGHGYITAYEGPNTDTPHYAFDLQTPFHTSLTAPLSGTVKVADYQGWGGEIFIQPDNSAYPEYYFYHPDEVDVKVGQHVNAGQFIGLSGGENPGYPGAEHPASPEWSSGPHTHVGWFTKWQDTPVGTRPYGPDPSNLIQIAQSGGGGMPSNVPANVYNAVEPIAQKYGVPDAIWETVAYVESGFNTGAVGDNGTSFGIFQLHEGGQFPSAYLNNPHALDDPALNAQYAMPAIASAWKALQPTFDAGSSSWWEQFAAQSGHPGGSPGQTVTNNEAGKLQSDYSQFSGGQTGIPLSYTGQSQTCTPPSGIQIANPAAWGGYWGCMAKNAANNPATSIGAGIAQWIGSTTGPFLLRVGVGLAGLTLVWIGTNAIASALEGKAFDALDAGVNKVDERASQIEHIATLGTQGKSKEKPDKEKDKEEKKEPSKSGGKSKEEKKPDEKKESKPAAKKPAAKPAASTGEAGAGEAAAGGGSEAAAAAALV